MTAISVESISGINAPDLDILNPALRFFQDNSASFHPFSKILDVLERRAQAAFFTFEFMKKYLFSKKLETKHFLSPKSIGRF